MLKLKILTYLLIGLFLIKGVSASTIYGTVYDLNLRKVNNARVEINTLPKQFMVAQNGTYSFNVPNGVYTIKAESVQKNIVVESVEENITVKQDGNYVVDLILFPNIEEGVEDIGIDVNENVVETEKKNNFLMWFLILLILVISLIGIYTFKKRREQKKETTITETKIEQKEYEKDLQQIIEILKKEGGRTTQKEIRKQIPLSEAKISLMISELEHKGIIEKIKKGRGNIIILKRK